MPRSATPNYTAHARRSTLAKQKKPSFQILASFQNADSQKVSTREVNSTTACNPSVQRCMLFHLCYFEHIEQHVSGINKNQQNMNITDKWRLLTNLQAQRSSLFQSVGRRRTRPGRRGESTVELISPIPRPKSSSALIAGKPLDFHFSHFSSFFIDRVINQFWSHLWCSRRKMNLLHLAFVILANAFAWTTEHRSRKHLLKDRSIT